MKYRLYKKRIYGLFEITLQKFQLPSNGFSAEKKTFFNAILNKEGFAFVELATEPSPLLLCFWHGQAQTFSLISSDKGGRGSEMKEWLDEVRERFRGSEFKFEIRFPENLQKFREGMQVFKKTP